MRSPLIAISLLSSVARAATSYLLPLYGYPSSDCWPELISAAAKYPEHHWTLILNPNSGPGEGDPEDQYMKCIPVLRSKVPNSTLVGYVSTLYGERTAEEVVGNIALYYGWKEIDSAVDGIFLDELPNEAEDCEITRYSAYSNVIKSAWGEDATIIMNPGTKTDDAFYTHVTSIVSYETSWKEWKPEQALVATAASPFSKQAIMIHSLPTDSKVLSSLLDLLVIERKVGAVWLSDLKLEDQDIYHTFPSVWDEMIAGVAERSV